MSLGMTVRSIRCLCVLVLFFGGTALAATPDVPNPTSPSGAIDDSTPTYTWSALDNASWYYLFVQDSNGVVIQQWYSAVAANCETGAGTCSITPSAGIASGAAKFRVIAYNNDGFGPWSAETAFTVRSGGATLVAPLATELQAPDAVVNLTTPTYSWNAIANASRYRLRVVDSTGLKIKLTYTASEVNCADGTGTCSVTPNVELAPGAAKFRVRTRNSAGSGPWSAVNTFTVATPTPPEPSPAPTSVVNNTAAYPASDIELCTLVNEYRGENGLSPVPLSRALMTTARHHALDRNVNRDAYTGSCNLHSWGNSATSGTNGDWNACCYAPDHSDAQCMVNKPTEITANWTGLLQPYTGNGYENAASGYPNNAAALNGWKNSPGHNVVMLNQGGWANLTWTAMGCGSNERDYYLIFSDTADPNPAP